MSSSGEVIDGGLAASWRADEGQTASRQTILAAFYILLCVVSLLPFVLIANPPILDFANHAARLSLACNIHDPAVADMYVYRLGIIPNLAVDLANAPLCGLLGPSAVLKAVTAGSLALIYFCGWTIQRKLFGSPNAFLLLLPAVAFNLVTTMGYINFLAGAAIGCAMIALALGREKKFTQLLLIGNVGGIVLFFCHIFALAFVGVFFFGLMLRDQPRTVRGFATAALKTAAMFALPLVMVPLVPSEGKPLAIHYIGKIRVLPALFMAPHPNPSVFGLLFLAPLYLLIRNRRVEIHPALRVPLAVLALYVLLVPNGIQDAIDIDSRTAIPLAYLFFMSLRPIDKEREISGTLFGASAALVGYGAVMAALIWLPFSRQVEELRGAFGVLPPEASVFSVAAEDGPRMRVFPFGYNHLTSYATVDRRVFNPLEFSGIGMQPLSSTPKFAPIDSPGSFPVTPAQARKLEHPTADLQNEMLKGNGRFKLRWPEHFDYVIFYHFGHFANFRPELLTEVHRGSFFSILKVRRPQPQRG